MPDPLKPSTALLCKLGSIIGHVNEMLGPRVHHVDKAALDTVLADSEVQEWYSAMGEIGLVPVLRTAEDARLGVRKGKRK